MRRLNLARTLFFALLPLRLGLYAIGGMTGRLAAWLTRGLALDGEA
jgi:hypothetical protein